MTCHIPVGVATIILLIIQLLCVISFLTAGCEVITSYQEVNMVFRTLPSSEIKRWQLDYGLVC